MTQEETRKLLTVIRAAYPNFFKTMPDVDQTNMLMLWSDVLKDDDPIKIMVAAKSFIRSNTSQFPPTVGQIVDLSFKLSNPPVMTEQEAWGFVDKALRNSIYNSESEFAKLPPEVQTTVGTPKQLKEWAQMDIHELNTVVSSNFMRSFKARVAENKEFAKLPAQAQDMIKGLTNMMSMNKCLEEMED